MANLIRSPQREDWARLWEITLDEVDSSGKSHFSCGKYHCMGWGPVQNEKEKVS